jgi:hypothetical protein
VKIPLECAYFEILDRAYQMARITFSKELIEKLRACLPRALKLKKSPSLQISISTTLVCRRA